MALTDNLQAFYKLSDLTDSSGNNRTLTNNGNVSFASGKIGNAAVFDGSNWTTSPISGISSEYTVSGWFRSETTNSYTMLFNAKSQENALASFVQLLGDGSVRFGSGNYDSGELVIAGQNKNDNQWHFFCAVVGNNNTKLFLDNDAAVALGSQFSNFSFTDIAFASYVDGSYDHLNGQIDALGIWNRALSDAEVAELYNNGTGLELDGVAQPTLVKMQALVKFFGKVKFGV